MISKLIIHLTIAEKDYIGIETDTGRLMSLASEADYEEYIPIKKSILRK